MSRPLRIEWPGALYHVTSRGDRREPIVEDDADRLAWVELLGETCDRFNWRMHAWCLMGNHYHLLVETPEANLSHGMRHLNGVWSQAFNRQHRRVGHVFQGRFKAIMVERESYLMELARYVVLNPVRACVVNGAAEYRWSSYRATVGSCDAPNWLETDWLLSQFSLRREEAVSRYVDHVRAGVGLPSVWQALHGQIYMGSECFVRDMQARLGDEAQLREVPMLQRRGPKRPLCEFAAGGRPRDEAMAAASASGHYTHREIAEFFHVHESTVSRAVRGARLKPRNETYALPNSEPGLPANDFAYFGQVLVCKS